MGALFKFRSILKSIFKAILFFMIIHSVLADRAFAEVRSWDIHTLPDRTQWLVLTGSDAAKLMNPTESEESGVQEFPRAVRHFLNSQNWSDVIAVDSRILCGHKHNPKAAPRKTASLDADSTERMEDSVCLISLTSLIAEPDAPHALPESLFMNMETYLSLADQRAEALFHHPAGVPLDPEASLAVYDYKGLALPPHERRQVGPLLCGRIETEQPASYSLTSFQGLEDRASNFFSIAERGSWEFGSKFTQYYCLLALKPEPSPVARKDVSWLAPPFRLRF